MIRVLRCNSTRRLQEQAVREFHDVRLVSGGDPAPTVRPGVLEREAHDPLARALAHRLDRQAGVLADTLTRRAFDERDDLGSRRLVVLELDPRIAVLCVLAYDDDVDVLVARSNARVQAARPKARVEVELDAQGDVRTSLVAPDRGGERSLQRDAVQTDRLEDAERERGSLAIGSALARLLDIPVDVDAGRLDGASRGVHQLRPGAVTGYERHAMGHTSPPPCEPWRAVVSSG
jgi:hypothetical protein